jgi:hypothetical protein
MQEDVRNVIAAGFPEMWQPVYLKYRLFFDCAAKLQPILGEIISTPVEGSLAIVAGHLTAAAANSYGALLTLVLNGFGHDAVKIARGIYEVDINVLWLKNHPTDVEDFLDYNIIQQKEYYDALDEEQKITVPKERLEELTREYGRIFPRFASARDKTRPRNDWCKVSIYQRAKHAEEQWKKQLETEGMNVSDVSLYESFYGPASSIHHMDIAGVIAYMDSDLNAHMEPSWEYIEDALVATGSLLRVTTYFADITGLNLEERLAAAVADYVAACNGLEKRRP